MSNTIKETYDKLVKEKEEILQKAAPLEKQKEEKLAVLRAAEKEYNAVCEEYKAITQPRLYDVSVEIAALARLLPNHVKPE